MSSYCCPELCLSRCPRFACQPNTLCTCRRGLRASLKVTFLPFLLVLSAISSILCLLWFSVNTGELWQNIITLVSLVMFLGLGTFYSYRACSLRPALFPLLEEAVDANGVFLLGRVAAAEQAKAAAELVARRDMIEKARQKHRSMYYSDTDPSHAHSESDVKSEAEVALNTTPATNINLARSKTAEARYLVEQADEMLLQNMMSDIEAADSALEAAADRKLSLSLPSQSAGVSRSTSNVSQPNSSRSNSSSRPGYQHSVSNTSVVSRYSSLAPSASITSGTAAPTSTAKGIVVLDVDEEGYDPEVDARAYSAATEAWLDQRRLAALGEPDSNSEGANVISEPIHDLTSLDAERSKFIARTKHFVNELAIRPSNLRRSHRAIMCWCGTLIPLLVCLPLYSNFANRKGGRDYAVLFFLLGSFCAVVGWLPACLLTYSRTKQQLRAAAVLLFWVLPMGVLAPVLALSTLGSAGFGALLFLLLLLLFCGAVLSYYGPIVRDRYFEEYVRRALYESEWAAAPEFVEVAVDEEYERKNAYDDWEIIQFHERPELRAALKVPDDFQIDPKILQPNYTPHESNNSAATENFERSNNSFSRPPSNQVSRPTSATASRTISMADRYSSINSVQSIKSSYSGVSVDAASVARTESVLSQVTLPGSVDETHESQLSAAREHTEIEPPKLTGAALRAALRQQEQMRDKELQSEMERLEQANEAEEKARQQAALDALKPKVVPKEVEEEEPVDDFEARLAEEEARLEAEEAAKEREIERLKQLERDRIKAEARERQRIIDEHAAAEREAERQAREQHQAMLAAMSPVERRAYDARPRVMTAADDIPLASHYAPEIIERLFENALDEQLKMVERRSEDVVMRVTQQLLNPVLENRLSMASSRRRNLDPEQDPVHAKIQPRVQAYFDADEQRVLQAAGAGHHHHTGDESTNDGPDVHESNGELLTLTQKLVKWREEAEEQERLEAEREKLAEQNVDNPDNNEVESISERAQMSEAGDVEQPIRIEYQATDMDERMRAAFMRLRALKQL